jgi:hypothetical protein
MIQPSNPTLPIPPFEMHQLVGPPTALAPCVRDLSVLPVSGLLPVWPFKVLAPSDRGIRELLAASVKYSSHARGLVDRVLTRPPR